MAFLLKVYFTAGILLLFTTVMADKDVNIKNKKNVNVTTITTTTRYTTKSTTKSTTITTTTIKPVRNDSQTLVIRPQGARKSNLMDNLKALKAVSAVVDRMKDLDMTSKPQMSNNLVPELVDTSRVNFVTSLADSMMLSLSQQDQMNPKRLVNNVEVTPKPNTGDIPNAKPMKLSRKPVERVDFMTSDGVGKRPQPMAFNMTSLLSMASSVQALDELRIKKERIADYELFEGIGKYKLYTKAQTWGAAYFKCKADGAKLLVINSFKERDVIVEMVDRIPKEQFYVHIGFHDSYVRRHFVTVDGLLLKEAGFDSWAPQEPNNPMSENCGSVTREGYLNDIECDALQPYICELQYEQTRKIPILG